MERLIDVDPVLYGMLHKTKNQGVNLEKLTPGSNKKVWWQCPNFSDHSWQDSPVSSRRYGSKCLICSNKRVLSGFNDLATKNPQLAKQWHPVKNGDLTSSDVFPNSNKLFWWICQTNESHEWEQSASNQSKSVGGCPFCSNRRILPGDNDLATKNPELIAKWDWGKNSTILPVQVSAGSPRSVYWLCELGHSFSSPIVNMAHGAGCPFCSSSALLPGFNDLATTHPDLLSLFSPENSVSPSQIMAGSDKRLKWLCPLGHTWVTQVKNIRKGTRCPVCDGKQLLQGFNDLGTKSPAIAAEWHPSKNGQLMPQDVIGGGKTFAWWQCQKGHEWRSTIGNRVFFKSGCPVCQNTLLQPGANDMETTNPALAAQFDLSKNFPATPKSMIASTHKMLWWKCDLGHSWRSTGNTRISQGTGCPVCSGKQVLEGFNDLATRYPELSKQWHPTLNGYLKPEHVSGGSHKKVWWKCDQGHDFSASLVNRAALASNCRICVNQEVLAGYNDLASQWPELLSEWDYEKNKTTPPDSVIARSEIKYWWICDQGHSWRVSPGVRIRVGTGCPTCANRGYSQAASGTFYFIQNPSLAARKVGIANQKSNRLDAWTSLGWEIVFKFNSDEGRLILQLETNILRWIRKELGYPPYLSPSEVGKLRGWSETFSDDGISNFEVTQKIQSELEHLLKMQDKDRG